MDERQDIEPKDKNIAQLMCKINNSASANKISKSSNIHE